MACRPRSPRTSSSGRCRRPPAPSDRRVARTPDPRARPWPRPATAVYGGAMGPRTPWLGLMVTTLLVGLGLTEDADGARGVETGVVLPVGVLVGGGLLVLAGTILEGVLPGPGPDRARVRRQHPGRTVDGGGADAAGRSLRAARLAAARDASPDCVRHTGAPRRTTRGDSSSVGAR